MREIEVGILQIMGRFQYDEVDYVIDDRSYPTTLTSLAIKEYLGERGIDSEVCILVPESLVEMLSEDVSQASQLLSESSKFRERVAERTGYDVECLIIPSIGEYGKKYKIVFEGSIENTICVIFKKLVEKDFDVVYADVSTGLNIYTVAMVEALRRYITYKKLKSILKKPDFDFKLVFLPPLNKEVHIEFQDIDVMAFFSLPKVNVYRICKTNAKDINIKYNKLLRGLKNCMESLKIAFNSIKMNTPLAFYHKEILDFKIDIDGIESELIYLIEDALKPTITMDRGMVVRRRVLDSKNIANIFYSLGLLRNIKEFQEGLDEPELDKICESFEELYTKLGLGSNIKFLQNDVESIKKNVGDGFIGLYIECFQSGNGKMHGSQDKKRNFFAHSGFLREYTFVERRGNDITVRWDEKRLGEIKGWIQSPE